MRVASHVVYFDFFRGRGGGKGWDCTIVLLHAWFFVSVKKLQTFFIGFDNGLLAKNDLRERGRRGRGGEKEEGQGCRRAVFVCISRVSCWWEQK